MPVLLLRLKVLVCEVSVDAACSLLNSHQSITHCSHHFYSETKISQYDPSRYLWSVRQAQDNSGSMFTFPKEKALANLPCVHVLQLCSQKVLNWTGWSFDLVLPGQWKIYIYWGVLGNNPAEVGSVITKISDPWEFYWFVALFCITLDVTEPGAATTR